VKQRDGIVILEAPISACTRRGAQGGAQAPSGHADQRGSVDVRFLAAYGGVRQAVALGLPVYVLDLNQPVARQDGGRAHTMEPDALQKSKISKTPHWKIVAKKQEIGSGTNRMELYPLRGASTERQYMVYFPEHHLLYASDTLALNDDGTLYDPELMYEVAQAVKRENLIVDTVFAMHQGPMPWEKYSN